MPFLAACMARAPMCVAAAAALYIGAVGVTPPAWAHVHASSDTATRGAMALVTFEVPNESDRGAATTALTVLLPDVASARTEAMPGWTAKLDRDASAGTVRSVTWTAAPNGGIGVDQFALFRIAVRLPDADTVSFPATQTYADGSVVKWDQPPLPGGGEPEHPAPMLSLSAEPANHHHHSGIPTAHAGTGTSGDTIARILGGAALAVAAIGMVLVLIRRRT
ncbi:YcnI family copper-binding membrane protein [Mycobacterium simiae]|uniref:YcnI family copper-binding membrane protein n=1 Tax=Mycobacterium simiae TaxID=1784 RepID=UPI000778D7F2|nr:YcnI family protein [Mycobacterium simiae]